MGRGALEEALRLAAADQDLVAQVQAAWDDPSRAGLRRLARAGVRPALLRKVVDCFLEHEEPALRRLAITLLREKPLASPASQARLRAFLADPDPGVREEAVIAAGALRDQEAVPALLRLLPQGDVVARRAEIQLYERPLVRRARDEAVALVIGTTDVDLRVAMLEFLASPLASFQRPAPGQLDPLRELVGHRDPRVRAAAERLFATD